MPSAELRDRRGQVEGENHQRDADQHGGRDIDQRFHIPSHVQFADQAVQQPGQHQHF